MLTCLLQTIQSKDGLDDTDDSELQPLSAVEVALKLQQQRGPPPEFPALPQASGTDSAAVAAASHGHLHMPFFEKVDIGALLCLKTLRVFFVALYMQACMSGHVCGVSCQAVRFRGLADG